MPPVIAGVAAGIASGVAAAGVATITVGAAWAIGAAVAVGTIALQKSLQPDMPSVDESVNEQQTLTTQPLQPRRGIYGETVVSGSIVGYGKRKVGDKDAHETI